MNKLDEKKITEAFQFIVFFNFALFFANILILGIVTKTSSLIVIGSGLLLFEMIKMLWIYKKRTIIKKIKRRSKQ